MKVKKQDKKKHDLKLKDVRVKLTKLTKVQIQHFLNPNGKKSETFNLTFKLNGNNWTSTNNPNNIVTVVRGNNIFISHRINQHQHQLPAAKYHMVSVHVKIYPQNPFNRSNRRFHAPP